MEEWLLLRAGADPEAGRIGIDIDPPLLTVHQDGALRQVQPEPLAAGGGFGGEEEGPGVAFHASLLPHRMRQRQRA
ncbi:hypothetical protein ACFVYD_33335 [Streptomyces sp. NPDC058301]|uniref:hypothetical protein n=1 Tax=Streptomyces sp. NPDC058301 TaxID=3346436 RepID=UPI0036E97C54